MKENNITYREKRKLHDRKLIGEGQLFNNDKANKPYLLKNKDKASGFCHLRNLLLNGKNNLYHQISDEVVLYFAFNQISFHHLEGDMDAGFCIPSGHTLSSQVACLNHLYPLRYDKEAVLAMARTIHPEIEDVMPIETDKFLQGYIAFEVTSKKDHLNEIKAGKKPTRGKMCTSVDAMIYGKLKSEKKMIIAIEWKYTENYHDPGKPDKDYSIENGRNEQEGKGKERLRRYSGLIDNSIQLSLKKGDYRSSIHFFEPFYQLMRQTLWAEQMIINKEFETIKADSFIHVHIVPADNKELLYYQYPVSKKGMEESWRSCLTDPEKYRVIDPKDLLANIDRIKYQPLIEYLSRRYWDEDI